MTCKKLQIQRQNEDLGATKMVTTEVLLTVNGDPMERLSLFCYLGQDDPDTVCINDQLQRAQN